MGELKEPTEKREAEGEGTKYIERMRALQNHAEELEKKRKQMEKFKVSDKVHSSALGDGIVTEIRARGDYPIVVKWAKGSPYADSHSIFTLQGHYDDGMETDNDIHLLAAEEEDIVKEDKIKTDDAVNPSHYQVEGIPEAIEIMAHLMTKEQFEGFLWGNILKYAYRYGRKGDKEETAGKIAWYAKKLEEVVGNAAV